MDRRQLINNLKPSPTQSTTVTRPHCTPFTLPSNGIINLGESQYFTLTTNAIFTPECTGTADIVITSANSPASFPDLRDPFYASTIPECYALAATTVIAYMLVIMLLITPRTFLVQGAVVLGRRGFTNGPSGSDAGIGIGGRPWLQKVAALTVAVSLTIATADTFRVAEEQYELGFMNVLALQDEVDGGLELKIIRVISDTFLWLAQAQTLIRLFPRQREKIIIKWTGFALITLDVLFSLLNNFVYNGTSRPRSFTDAVPALAYLFQLALSLLYCAWVIYYAISKKRYAFYHPQMRNICLVALLSLVSVLVPVVFFVLDISKPTLAAWGDYVRWVGAAAASVVVWEWVERIEALERNEKKDGVLGREVFDGDEMLEVTPTSDWTNHFRKDGDDKGGTATGSTWPAMSGLANRYRPRATNDLEAGPGSDQLTRRHLLTTQTPLWPTRPEPIATPINRADTASAESTVYAVRYHPISDATPPIVGTNTTLSRSNSEAISISRSISNEEIDFDKPVIIDQGQNAPIVAPRAQNWHWNALNPFRHRVQGPPAEVLLHTPKPAVTFSSHESSNRWDMRARIEGFAAAQAERFREKTRPTVNTDPLPLTVIPAPRRRANAPVSDFSGSDSIQPAPEGSSQIESESNQHTRTSDPYTPDSLQRHSITHRGSISFATAVQPETDQRFEDTTTSPTLVNSRQTHNFSSLRSSPVQARSPVTPALPSIIDGLPVKTIPAPPRRPRVEDP
ncbi:522382ac-d88d-40f3-ad1a-518b872a88fb-CDS [Sclerotinia trifoliorum]|uniref:522382ac-d88d-40f3-ad1a-518b872a88fb-CDS n=1 Tax=Sclerotinia trifoliorum TaxID=28548 RepID=A0A8H2ZPN0_9HELO|nr:522382ac-d88d-40f3-ad1a-518b872a88fb-CDS [Sclerotinia trifoliorum]